MENTKEFLNKFINDVNEGKYDKELKLPFMSKKLLIDTVKGKINRKIEKNVAPVLTDAEIKLVFEEIKETAGTTFYIFRKYGLLEETDEGYQISKKGQRALIEALKIM